MADRMKPVAIKPLLICLTCKTALKTDTDALVCGRCEVVYPLRATTPIMLRADNELFPQSDYVEMAIQDDATAPGNRRGILSYLPKRSVNICRDRLFTQLATSFGDSSPRVLVIGAGRQAGAVLESFESTAVEFVFCDIIKSGDVDVYCDAHELPFSDGAFDGVITTAVMEHVMYPERVADEIVRVVCSGGFVYSEIPFLQAVHEGAYDFTRFTMSGHRRLFEEFTELDSGMVAGPGTVLVWTLETFNASLFRNPKLSKLARLSTRVAFFWLKYLDKHMVNSPAALDGASCTYFWGRKEAVSTTAGEIISRYERRCC